MSFQIHPKAIATAIVLLFSVTLFAQTQYDGDMFAFYLGKGIESPELKEFKANYKCEMANQTHYLSKSGIELHLKNDALSNINLYKTSAVYGDFKGVLPKGLKFGMSSSDAKAHLGKPSVAYNTGYCEFEFPTYTITCWFENSALVQLGIDSK